MRGEASIQAQRVAERLQKLTEQHATKGKIAGRPKHIVISQPSLLPESKKNDRKAVQKYIEACRNDLVSAAKDGWSGGVHIFHPCRRKGLNRDTYEWEAIEDDAPEGQYIKTKWVWSPHVHFMAFGYFENGKEHFKRTGFILKRIEDGAHEDPFESVKKRITYLLTHSGIWVDPIGDQRGQAYAYFGQYSTNIGGRDKEWVWETTEHKCDKCQTQLVKFEFHPIVEPILEFRKGRIVLEDNYLQSWNTLPHDLQHGFSCEDYITRRKVYGYHLNCRPSKGTS